MKYVKPAKFESVESSSTKFDENKREIPDRRPLELLLTLQKAVKTNEQHLKELVTRELNKLARTRGFESLEEANDFSMNDEDYQQLSGYEFTEDTFVDAAPPVAAPSAAPPAAPPAAPAAAPAAPPAAPPPAPGV